MAVFACQLDVKPHAKQRPRATRQGHIYTPSATKYAEKEMRDQWLALFPDAEPLEGPLYVDIAFGDGFMTVHIDNEADEPTSKVRGDVDNLGKTILDALNGIAYKDDSQVVELHLRKL